MASSIATYIVRRTARIPFSHALFSRHCPAFFCSPLASYSYPHHCAWNSSTEDRAVKTLAFSFFLRFASTKVGADEKLVSVLQSEIECVHDTEDHGRDIEVPEGFPFEIVDISGDQTIVIKREFGGENIKATIFFNFDEEGLSKEDEDDSEIDNQESAVAANISLLVAIDKGDGPVFEVGCSLSSSGLEIESVALKSANDSDEGSYQGPEFSDLDESLQKALSKYMKVRGFDTSLRDFLHEYMMNKDQREYLTWLKNVKEFVGK